MVLSADGARFDHGVRMRFAGARHEARPTTGDPLPGQSNYFIGSNSRRWRTGVPHYGQIRYESVYPGIDLLFHGNEQQLEYDFVLAAHADPALPQVVFSGMRGIARKLSVDTNGDLIAGDLRLRKPVAFQGADNVEISYRILGRNRVGFHLGPYDKSRPLVIDPTLEYSTVLQWSAEAAANAVAVDGAGNVYIAGSAGSHAVVAKLSPAGVFLYSNFFGGSRFQECLGIAIDAAGSAYVTGDTSSADFPTMNPFQGTDKSSPSNTAFVTKIAPSGSALIYSTYLGGSVGEKGSGITVDAAGNAYVAGLTASPDFPVVPTAPGPPAGRDSAFVTELNAAGSALTYSLVIGSATARVAAAAIAIDSAGNAYTGGSALGALTTMNALQPANAGASDAFVAKIQPGGALAYLTYLGGSNDDFLNAIAVGPDGSVYVAGYTFSSDFPTLNPLQAKLAGTVNAFVAKLNPAGTALVYSTYFGGQDEVQASGLAVDSSGNLYFAGQTMPNSVLAPNFPLVQSLQAIGGHVFVAKLDPTGGKILYSTRFGGSNSQESATGVAVDGSGQAHVVGSTSSTDFPLFVSAGYATPSAPPGAFYVKISDSTTAPCTFYVSPNTAAVSGSVGWQTLVTVAANQGNCAWQATSSVPWISVTPSGTGIGPATIIAAYNPNSTAQTGTIQIAGQTVTVTDAAQGQQTNLHGETGSAAGAPGQVARVPVTLALGPAALSTAVSGFALTVSVMPNGSAPPVTGALSFQQDPSLPFGLPNSTSSSQSLRLNWNVVPTSVSGPVISLGQVLVPIPSTAVFGQTYTVNVTSGLLLSGIGGAMPPLFVSGPGNTLTVGNPQPTAQSMNPSFAPLAAAGSPNTTVLVNGTGFLPTSTVVWNGTPLATTFVSEQQLQASIPANDLAAAGTASVQVNNPTPGGGLSATLNFLIASPNPPLVPNASAVNSADYLAGISGGGLVSLFGSNLASSTMFAGSLPLPLTLAGTSVLVDGLPAPLLFVSPTQINFQMPYRTLSETQTSVVVVANNVSAAPLPVQLPAAAPAIFTLNSQGTGQGAILNGAVFAAPLNSVPGNVSQPVKAGTGVSIYCTGLGALYEVSNNNQGGGFTLQTVYPLVTIGGVPATVLFSGLSPQFVGLYQVNVTVPAGIPSGSAVPVVMTLNGAASNTVTMAIQ